MIRPCNIRHCGGETFCKQCDMRVDYGDFNFEEHCPNKGRKILDVAFERLAPYFQELNKKKKIFIDVTALLKKEKK